MINMTETGAPIKGELASVRLVDLVPKAGRSILDLNRSLEAYVPPNIPPVNLIPLRLSVFPKVSNDWKSIKETFKYKFARDGRGTLTTVLTFFQEARNKSNPQLAQENTMDIKMEDFYHMATLGIEGTQIKTRTPKILGFDPIILIESEKQLPFLALCNIENGDYNQWTHSLTANAIAEKNLEFPTHETELVKYEETLCVAYELSTNLIRILKDPVKREILRKSYT